MTTQSSTSTVSVLPQRNLSPGQRALQLAGTIARYLVLIVLALTFILPFYWMASSALKDDVQIFTVPPIWIPNPAFWENFPDAWLGLGFNRYLGNTVLRYAVPAAIGATLTNAVIAYGFARLRWPGSCGARRLNGG